MITLRHWWKALLIFGKDLTSIFWSQGFVGFFLSSFSWFGKPVWPWCSNSLQILEVITHSIRNSPWFWTFYVDFQFAWIKLFRRLLHLTKYFGLFCLQFAYNLILLVTVYKKKKVLFCLVLNENLKRFSRKWLEAKWQTSLTHNGFHNSVCVSFNLSDSIFEHFLNRISFGL